MIPDDDGDLTTATWSSATGGDGARLSMAAAVRVSVAGRERRRRDTGVHGSGRLLFTTALVVLGTLRRSQLLLAAVAKEEQRDAGGEGRYCYGGDGCRCRLWRRRRMLS